MPTDPNMHQNGDRYPALERRLGDLEDSFEPIKAIALKSVTTVERAYDVAEQARQVAHELKESISNNAARTRELERAVRDNSNQVGNMAASLIGIEKLLGSLDKRLGKWPIEPDDKGSGLMGKVHTMGAHMGIGETRPEFDRSSYVDDGQLEAARDQSKAIARRMAEKEALAAIHAQDTAEGWEITQARKEVERLERLAQLRLEQSERTLVQRKPKKSTIPPAVKEAWASLPPVARGVVVTIATLSGIALSVWQALQAAGVIK